MLRLDRQFLAQLFPRFALLLCFGLLSSSAVRVTAQSGTSAWLNPSTLHAAAPLGISRSPLAITSVRVEASDASWFPEAYSVKHVVVAEATRAPELYDWMTQFDTSQALRPEVPSNAADSLARDLVRCIEPGLHKRRAARRPMFLLRPTRSAPSAWRSRGERDEARRRSSTIWRRRVFDIRIGGQDIAFRWSAGTTALGARPTPGSSVRLDTAGDTEIIELSFASADGSAFSSYVRGRRQPEDNYASAFGRSIQGTAGVQFDPGGRWNWRLQAQQQFINQVTDPIESVQISLWARLRF